MHLGFSQIHLLHKLKALANKQQTPFSLTHILKVLKEQNPGTVKVNYGDTSPDSPAKSRYSTGSPSCVNFFISQMTNLRCQPLHIILSSANQQ